MPGKNPSTSSRPKNVAPRNGVHAGITRDSIARAALSLIDRYGLEKLGVQNLATELGVQPPSLYHHFSNKTEILAMVARVIIRDTPAVPLMPPADWKDWLIEGSINLRKSMLAHPQAAPLLVQFYPRDVLAGAYERTSTYLSEAGVPYEYHLLIIDGLEKITFGFGASGSALAITGGSGVPRVRKDQHPHLAAAYAAAKHDPLETFARVIRMFLDGAANGWLTSTAGRPSDLVP